MRGGKRKGAGRSRVPWLDKEMIAGMVELEEARRWKKMIVQDPHPTPSNEDGQWLWDSIEDDREDLAAIPKNNRGEVDEQEGTPLDNIRRAFRSADNPKGASRLSKLRRPTNAEKCAIYKSVARQATIKFSRPISPRVVRDYYNEIMKDRDAEMTGDKVSFDGGGIPSEDDIYSK